MKLLFTAATDKGLKRAKNQDSVLCDPEHGIFAVADGMGGHHGGEIASFLALQNIEAYFKTIDQEEFEGKNKDNILEHAIWKIKESFRIANSAIKTRGYDQPELSGMGTTTSFLFFPDILFPAGKTEVAIIGQVGDSRCYYISQGKIWQLTRDHSLVQERLRAGLITRNQAKSDRNRNIITRSVGYETKLEVDTFWLQIHSKDIFLLCSDGLHGLVEDSEILETVQKMNTEGKNAEQVAQEMIRLANERGGDDNVSVVIAQVEL